MTMYDIEFWRGGQQVTAYGSDAFTSVEAAQAHIDDLLHAMMSNPREDWTGCRFEIIARSGERLLTVPVLTAMSALARKLSL